MAAYRIVAARPKGVSNHINSEFKLYRFNTRRGKWVSVGRKSINVLSCLMQAGDDIRTGTIFESKMRTGAAVELELRIAKNDTDYKISDMPDT